MPISTNIDEIIAEDSVEELRDPAAPSLSDDAPPQQGFVDTAAYAGQSIKPPARKAHLIKDKTKLVAAVIKNYQDDIHSRQDWADRRIQRTAKYRGWREIKSYPWVDASNAHLPVIMTDVQRTEDTLHNAVLSVHPTMNAKAASKEFEKKEQTVDELLDYQVFNENMGEERIGNLISSFCQDGQFIAYCPYIRQKQKLTKVYPIEYPPSGVSWDQHIINELMVYFPAGIILPGKKAWEFVVREKNQLTGNTVEYKVSVYEDLDKVQMVCHHESTIFDGPALLPIELEDIVVPVRCENLQPRTMANPTGAPRLVMVDYPDHDEIHRLYESGFYDELTKKDLEVIDANTGDVKTGPGNDPQAQKLLQDDLTGQASLHNDDPALSKEVSSANTLTRLTFFGSADLDGDGMNEEVVYWVIEETKTLLRARYLSEVYPMQPLRRPFAMAKYIPVNGQFYAIGLIEMMESGYDIIKQVFDQMIDSGSLANTPFGFYRPTSGVRPEQMRLGPGDLYPTNNPKDDIYFPTLPQGAGAFGNNIITMVSQILDQVTLVGQLQLGGVPQGRSSALRTTSNMQALLQQGDARPERVLRRFFGGLAEVWNQFHELNQIFLPKEKQFRVMRGTQADKNPYIALDDKSQIRGRFVFDFTASILNTNKALATQALQDMIGMLINPLMLQMGITTPETVYNLIVDYVRARGQDPLKYVKNPPGVMPDNMPKISVEDAILAIFNGHFPFGNTLEPLPEHIQKLKEFTDNPENFKYFSEGEARLLGQYVGMKLQEFQQAQMMQQQLMAAEQFAGTQGGNGTPGPQGSTAPPPLGPSGNPPVQGQEKLDETLPGAGGAV